MENVYINGFVSQGYLKSSANNYSGKTEEGHFQFNEAAVSIKTLLNDNLSAGFQLISRDFGDSGNNDVKLDWAFVDYRFNDALGVRLGKIKRPEGFYNSVRDADGVRTPILLPQGVYSERLRDILISIQGLSIYGFIDMGGAGSLDYTIYGGNQPIDTEEPIVRDVLLRSFYGITSDESADFKYALGAQVFWNTPVEGLRFGQSFYQSEVEVSGTNNLYPWYTSSIEDGLMKTPMRTVTSVEYQQEKYTIRAEYMMNKYELPETPVGGEITPYGFPAGGMYKFDLESYYLQFDYQLTEQLQLGAYHSWYYRRTNGNWDRDNPAERLNDTVLSAKYNIKDWWIVKAEVHFFDGYLFVAPDESGVPEDKWNLFAVKTTFTF